MTYNEYKLKLSELQTEFENKKKELAKEYAFANNSIKVGDIIKDSVGSIKVEKIRYTTGLISSNTPECVYDGIELTKQGTPSKRQQHTRIFQSNMVL